MRHPWLEKKSERLERHDQENRNYRLIPETERVLLFRFDSHRCRSTSNGKPQVSPRLFAEALRHFAGKRVYGGFKEDDPPLDGFGAWLQKESPRLNSRTLSPRHGSFVAAILCAEGKVRNELDGNAVVLHFPPDVTRTSQNP